MDQGLSTIEKDCSSDNNSITQHLNHIHTEQTWKIANALAMPMVMGLVVVIEIPCPVGVVAVVLWVTPKIARVTGVVVKDTTLDKSAADASAALGITPM